MINPKVREYVEASAKAFRHYETNHRMKGTLDALAKAEVNETLAEWGEEMLALIDSMGD